MIRLIFLFSILAIHPFFADSTDVTQRLIYSVSKDTPAVIEALIKAGAKVNMKNKNGWNADFQSTYILFEAITKDEGKTPEQQIDFLEKCGIDI